MTIDQIDWLAVRDEAADILSNYIKINTTNPPGNELEAARYLEGILKKEGIETTVYEPHPKRANLIAVLPGGGNAMVLLNHMDVVPVEENHWDLDPFGGIIKDGYIYGRGTIDMKGEGIADLMTMLLVKRHKIPLRRDIIFLATADEETGGTWGADWMLEHEPRLQEATFVLNEGGNITVQDDGKVACYEISTAQKVVSQFIMRSRGQSGHGSMPHQNSANVKLIRALNRILEWETPFMVIPLVREYFANRAKVNASVETKGYENLEDALHDPSFAATFASNPYHNAMVRNTLTPTVLKAGTKVNVIPSMAEAAFDCRTLPHVPVDEFFAHLKEIIDNEEIEIIPIRDFKSQPAPPSPVDNELYQTISRVAQRKDPGCIVTPLLATGATDSRFFRAQGIPCYDFSPVRLRQEDMMKLVHGHNERLSIENLGFASEFIFEIVYEVAAG